MHFDQTFFSSIVEYHVFVYTFVFLDRITSFEQLKNNNKYQNSISPIRWLTVTTKSKLTMHRITVKCYIAHSVHHTICHCSVGCAH